MEDEVLFAQSLQVKREADALLEESQLIPFLQRYGPSKWQKAIH
jgi:hypothetical protein